MAKVSKITPVMMRFGPSPCRVSELPSSIAKVLRLRNELTRAKAEVKSLKNELQQRECLDKKRQTVRTFWCISKNRDAVGRYEVWMVHDISKAAVPRCSMMFSLSCFNKKFDE